MRLCYALTIVCSGAHSDERALICMRCWCMLTCICFHSDGDVAVAGVYVLRYAGSYGAADLCTVSRECTLLCDSVRAHLQTMVLQPLLLLG